MSAAAFTPPTAAEILARLADPAFAAVVAEHVAADLAHATSYMTPGADHFRHIDARVAFYAAFPGAADAVRAQYEQNIAARAEEVAA